MNTLSPVSSNERIISIDVLRGAAVLGILIMNIQNFSMIGAAYMNPDAFGDLVGINKWVWVLSHITADQKFMTIFSVLFGAGVILFTGKAIEKVKKPGPIHFRRMFWLFVFGMVHAYLIWSGDILVNYALCGMFVFIFRNKSPKKLLILSAVFFIIPVLLDLMSGFSMPYWPEESVQENLKNWKPSSEAIAAEISNYQGNWLMQMDSRVGTAIFMQTFLFLWESFWRVTALMLLGMALFKQGILSAQRTNKFYAKLTLFGFILGLPLILYGIYSDFNTGWTMQRSMFYNQQFNYIGSVAIALAYIGIIMLIIKSTGAKKCKSWFAAVGKMAFTNYILESLICTFIFYGHGLGLYGQVERKFQILIVFACWILILIFSPIWLRYFRYGPLEWLWRSLTYWKVQPFKKSMN